jgi:hypothetical protein
LADVLACIDGSGYAGSVCDHAGWFASDPDVGVEVLQVIEPGDGLLAVEALDAADANLRMAVERLRDEGVGPITFARVAGGFVDLASSRPSDIIVMGKRGDLSEARRRQLGSSVAPMLRAAAVPVCLVPKVFLPIHRALVLLDDDLMRRAAIEFATSQPRLSVLPQDVLVVSGADGPAEAKVELARSLLGEAGGDVFSIRADGLDAAVAHYMEDRAADLVVVSRAVIATDPQASLQRIEARGLWGTRTPIVIC